ncbi:MAG TPA: hypothetical protein VNB49_10510 [Candidatus Dormibacteraeota bacterium]|nr:hypothetical protein [Candidatus Dormibacteraeota bacterium]
MTLTIMRYATTAALVGLTAAYGYYPHVTWIPIALAVVGALGIHVVPAQTPIQLAASQPSSQSKWQEAPKQ